LAENSSKIRWLSENAYEYYKHMLSKLFSKTIFMFKKNYSFADLLIKYNECCKHRWFLIGYILKYIL
jgi:hypothetical protein